MNLVKIGWVGVDWIGLVQDRATWKSILNAVINIGFI
jgi:hypothetical protein